MIQTKTIASLFYLTLTRMAMDTNVAPIFATLVMGFLEEKKNYTKSRNTFDQYFQSYLKEK